MEGILIELSDDMKMLVDNWIYLDPQLFNTEIFYYNVPIAGANICDDIGHIQGVSVGDLIKLQPTFSEVLGIDSDNDYIFYALYPLNNKQHQGMIFATDLSMNQYVFLVDKIQEVFSALYQKMGCEAFLKIDKNVEVLNNYLIPSCSNVIDLIEAIKQNEYLPEYVVMKYGKNDIHKYSKLPMMIPKDKNQFVIDLPQHMDFKTLYQKMELFKKLETKKESNGVFI